MLYMILIMLLHIFIYVSSMGAVFAFDLQVFIFLVSKNNRLCLSRKIRSLTFLWVLLLEFFGNLTFFPMHFLGIAGMPFRRIPDYPDYYAFFKLLLFFRFVINCTFSNLFCFVISFKFYQSNRTRLKPLVCKKF